MEQKSKSTLALMEQAIMILVFAFTAAFCVQAFVKAELLSRNLEMRDRAAAMCQTVAETAKALHGDMEEVAGILGGTATKDGLVLFLDGDWEIVAKENAAFFLHLNYKEVNSFLATGEVTVSSGDGEEIFSLPVNWQKEVAHE